MSALSGPANILLSQAKPPAQSNNAAQEAADTPFASVLQQKVKSGKEDSKPAETAAQAPADQANAPQQAQQSEAKSETPTAEAIVKGDHAETALQQLLPWLQSLQGQNAKPETTDKAAANDELLLPTAAAVTPQTQALQGLDLGSKAGARKDAADEQPGLQADVLKEDVKTASATANLAASNELTANKQKPEAESFDAVLQGVRADAQTAHAGTTQATAKHDGEPTRLQAPVGTPQWQNEFSDRVQLMSRNNESRAELILTPPHMGRIEVTLNISGDQANAMFISANPEVRNALEGAMDRLREALANNGIALGQAQVGAESSGQSFSGSQSGNRQSAALGGGAQEGGASAAWTLHSNNMLDVFA